MFETHEKARLATPFFVFEEGVRRWAYVILTSNDEWFFVTYETVVDGVSSQQQYFIPNALFLSGLSAKDNSVKFIRRVQLVSPPSLNQKGRWMMEPIQAIHRVGERYGYELMGGQTYPSELSGQLGNTIWFSDATEDE